MKVDQTPFLSSTLNTQPYFLNRIWTLSSSSLTSAQCLTASSSRVWRTWDHQTLPWTGWNRSARILNHNRSHLPLVFPRVQCSVPYCWSSPSFHSGVFSKHITSDTLILLHVFYSQVQTHLYRLQCVFHLFVQLYASYFTPNCSLKKKAGCVFITLRCRGTSSVLTGACLNKVYFIPFSQQTLLTEWRYNREDVLCY